MSLWSEENPDDCMTITDSFGRTLTLERSDGVVGAWIADVGDNDGVSVTLDTSARRRIAGFLLDGLE